MYNNLQATSSRLIDKFGKNVTLRTQTNSGTSYEPTITNSDATIRAVITSFKMGQIDGTLVRADDKQLITASTVAVDQKIIDGMIEYSIISVDEIKPADTALIYKAVLRK